jgi:adenosine deaminase
LADHPLPRLLNAELYVTVNSDDPPMFNTTLTGEYLALTQTFGFGADVVERLVLNAVRATLLSPAERAGLESEFTAAFADLRARFA